MRFALISDSHTKENIEYIYEYIRKKAPSWNLKGIIINGDIIGEDEVREGYGFNYNKTIFHASLDKNNILKNIVPNVINDLYELKRFYERGLSDENEELLYSKHIVSYVHERYEYILNILDRFSSISKVYYNIGTYESPLHFNVLKELAFLLDMPETYIRKVAMLSNYRNVFKEFRAKLHTLKNVKYIGGTPVIESGVIIAGIPGLNPNPGQGDSMGEFQEKITKDLFNTLRRQLSYSNKLILLNQTQGRLRKNPFAYRPGSYATRSYIEELKGKLRQKIFVQSYHHWHTTHFYEASEFHFILNNTAVNNCIFNILEIGNKVNCYDVDPKSDRVRKLNLYNYNLVDYSNESERLSLNYEDSSDIIKERNINGCYYM